MHISSGERKNNRNQEAAIVLHNQDTKLGEVIHINETHGKPKQYFAGKDCRGPNEYVKSFGTLSFINYGVTIHNANHVLAFGGTDKRGVKNQIGQHGEGLKHSIVALLREGMGVEIYTPIIRDGRAEFQKWRFYIQQGGPTDGNLYYKTTYLAPKTLLKGKNVQFDDSHHFELRITYSKQDYIDYDDNRIKGRPDGLQFDLFNYLAPREYIRSIRDEQDAGSLMTDIKSRGNIYVWHFFIRAHNPSYLRWGYDLFMSVTRERNMVEHEALVMAVAKVWSHVLEQCNPDDVRCEQFFNEIAFAKSNKNTFVEELALKFLTVDACKKLAQRFKIRYPNSYPVLIGDKEAADQQLSVGIMVVPARVERILFGDHSERFERFSIMLEVNAKILAEKFSNDLPVPEIIRTLFPELKFTFDPSNPLLFAEHGGQTFINWHFFGRDDYSEAEIIQRIMFEVYPFTLGDKHKTLPIFERFISMLEVKKKVISDEVVIINVADENDDGNDDENDGGNDGGDDGEISPHRFKRSREVPVDEPCRADNGFKWVKVEAYIKEKV